MATQPTQNAVPSESYRDLKYNAGKIDEFVTSLQREYEDRFGKKHYTIEGLRWVAQQAIAAFGYITLDSFEDGNTLTLPNQVLRLEATGEYYRWDGAFPKDVPAGSTPDSTGGVGIGKWLSVGDATLRGDLSKNTGASMIGTSSGDNIQEEIDATKESVRENSSAYYRDRCIKKLAEVDYLIQTKGNVKVLFQGDSMTAGLDGTTTDSVDPSGEDWARHAYITYPERVAAYMSEQSGVDIEPTVRAISGYNVKQAYEQSTWQSNPNCDLMIIMYGLNDAGDSGNPAITIAEYMEYMEKMILRAIDWGMGVVVCSLAWGGYGSNDAKSQAYAKRIKNMATLYGCAYFNANEVSYYREFSAIQSDAGHFNSNGYSKLGESISSMLMAGGLMPHYRPISSEITLWPGIKSDQACYHDASGNISTSRAPGSAYTLSSIVGQFPSGQQAVMSFSFYHDSDSSDIEVVGSWDSESKLAFAVSQQTTTPNNIPYYEPSPKQQLRDLSLYEPGPSVARYSAVQNTGMRKRLGSLVGRGWKTITVFNSSIPTTNAFIQALIVRPLPMHLASSPGEGTVRYGVTQCVTYSLPARDTFSSSGGAPDPTILNELIVKLPYDLYPMVRDSNVEFFDCGFATIKIKAMGGSHGNSYFEGIISKTASGYTLDVLELKSVGTWPTITAQIGKISGKVTTAKDSFAPSMPIEDIREMDFTTFTPSTTGNEYGLFAKISLGWAEGTTLNGYYNVMIESSARGLGGAAVLSI
ncbi:tail fiber/spike domain-containing protein [Enterobacter hormaechei]